MAYPLAFNRGELVMQKAASAAASPTRLTLPMRIAVIGGRGVPSSYSGVERICEDLFSLFAQWGHHVTVYCRPEVLSIDRAMYKGIRLVRTSAPGGKNFETLSHTFSSLVHALNKGDVHDGGKRFDLISLHTIAPNFWARLPRMYRTPVVTHVHGLDWQREKWKGIGAKVIQRAERSMVKNVKRVVTVNQSIVEYYKTNYGLDAALIPNGIHPVSDQFSPDRAVLERYGLTRGKYIVGIGRLVPEKRQHDLLAAFATIPSEWKLVIVGEGKHTPEYVAQLHRQGGSDPRVVFTGHQSGAALETLFRSAGLYVSASELEGLPASLLECMERNVPTVLSAIPPHVELLGKIAGYDYFFKPGDVAGLKTNLMAAMSNIDRAKSLAEDARTLVRTNYAWPVLARKTEELYQRVLGWK